MNFCLSTLFTDLFFGLDRLGYVGSAVLTHVGWFHFLVVQLAAVVLMASSISSEARAGSLQVLLATPISGLQVAVGKLLAGLLPCAVLVLVSVPVLTLVGLFGGVDWRSALASAAVTLSAAALSGGVAMWFSAVYQRVEGTLLVSVAIVLGAYPVLLALSYLVCLTIGQMATQPIGASLSGGALGLRGLAPADAGRLVSVPPTNGVVVHCTILLAAAVWPVLFAAKAIRRTALARSMGGPSASPGAWPEQGQSPAPGAWSARNGGLWRRWAGSSGYRMARPSRGLWCGARPCCAQPARRAPGRIAVAHRAVPVAHHTAVRPDRLSGSRSPTACARNTAPRPLI